MTYPILHEQNPLSEDTDILAKGIANNAKQHGLDPIEPFAFFIRDEDNTIKGGCNGQKVTLHQSRERRACLGELIQLVSA